MPLSVNNLVGFGGKRAAAGGGAGPTSLTIQGFVESTTSSVDVSGVAADGDLLVFVDAAANSPTSVTPSGATVILDQLQGVTQTVISYKVYSSGDSAFTTMNGDADEVVQVLVLRPDAAITTVTVTIDGTEATNGDPGSITITGSGETTPVACIGVHTVRGTVGSISTAMSPAGDSSNYAEGAGAVVASQMEVKVYSASPANHTWDGADEGGNQISCGFTLEVS